MSQCDATFYLKINGGHIGLYFTTLYFEDYFMDECQTQCDA